MLLNFLQGVPSRWTGIHHSWVVFLWSIHHLLILSLEKAKAEIQQSVFEIAWQKDLESCGQCSQLQTMYSTRFAWHPMLCSFFVGLFHYSSSPLLDGRHKWEMLSSVQNNPETKLQVFFCCPFYAYLCADIHWMPSNKNWICYKEQAVGFLFTLPSTTESLSFYL